jgi:O-antigen ligase
MTDIGKFGGRFGSSADMTASARIESQPAIDLDTLVRSLLFIAVFLSAWISFHPFVDLSEPPQAVVEGGDLANQLGFSGMFLAFALWTFCHDPRRILLVLHPVLIAVIAWCFLSVVASWEPATAGRRLVFALIVMSLAAMVLLLPKNLRHFSDLMSITVLIVLAACYLGVLLLPQYAIHHATDFLEPEHDGSWRGVFPHKNDAGATMVLFVFVGLYVARVRNFALGMTIVVLSSIFLGFSQSKTAIGVLPIALLLSAIIARSRGPAIGVILVVGGLLAFNLFSVGTVMFEPVRKLVEAIMPDATFTGRTEIWELGLRAVEARPITGYGYSTFWGTEQVVYGMGETVTWANAASDAHNAYLNLALTIGIPGMVLVVLWVIVVPIMDFCRRSPDADTTALQTLFLRVCLYGAYASCFESSILQQVGEVWFFFMTSTFGLRYLAMTNARA